MRSIVVDLRFNPGGLMGEAAELVDEFVKDGPIVSTKGRQVKETQISADPTVKFQEGNVVVLVNDMSASASEIVSGALKDRHRAIIIGERTYGKGSVQNPISIANHSAILKITTAYYYLPSGRLLHRRNSEPTWGVDPDVDVHITPKQMKRWLDLRHRLDTAQENDPAILNSDLRNDLEADIQLQTAVLVLKLMDLQKPSDSMAKGQADKLEF
jgi:carboxyl-terminal processing protease